MGCIDAEIEVLNLIDKECVHTNGSLKMNVDDWSFGSSSRIRPGVLTGRAQNLR